MFETYPLFSGYLLGLITNGAVAWVLVRALYSSHLKLTNEEYALMSVALQTHADCLGKQLSPEPYNNDVIEAGRLKHNKIIENDIEETRAVFFKVDRRFS